MSGSRMTEADKRYERERYAEFSRFMHQYLGKSISKKRKEEIEDYIRANFFPKNLIDRKIYELDHDDSGCPDI